jgi:16S rRNA G966 N2-methylase RsmD
MSQETSLEKNLIPFFSKLDKSTKVSVYSGDFDFYMFRVFFPHVYSVRGYTVDSIAFIDIEDFNIELLNLHYIIIIRNPENKKINLMGKNGLVVKDEMINEFSILYIDRKNIKSRTENKINNNIVDCSYVCSLFPVKSGVDTSKIKISTVGLYSVTSYKFNEKIKDIILQHNNNNKNILIMDCTACVGGDSIGFGLTFSKVISIEYDKINYQCLLNNIEIYKLNNVVALNFDFLEQGFDVIKENKPDVLYFDPPWGGKDYYLQDKIELFLNNKNIKDIIRDIFSEFDFVSNIVVKAPSNYNIDESESVKIYDLHKFKVVVFKK